MNAQRRYNISEKGRERSRRYNRSEKGRERARRYDRSEKGRERDRRYYQNPENWQKFARQVIRKSVRRREEQISRMKEELGTKDRYEDQPRDGLEETFQAARDVSSSIFSVIRSELT